MRSGRFLCTPRMLCGSGAIVCLLSFTTWLLSYGAAVKTRVESPVEVASIDLPISQAAPMLRPPIEDPFDFLHHVPAFRLLYCELPKSASTTVKDILHRLFHPLGDLPREPLGNRTIHGLLNALGLDGSPSNVTRCSAYTAQATAMLLGSSTVVRFVVVRKPVRRFVSALVDKCVRHYRANVCPVTREAVLRAAPTADLAPLAVAALDALQAQPVPASWDKHFRPQVSPRVLRACSLT